MAESDGINVKRRDLLRSASALAAIAALGGGCDHEAAKQTPGKLPAPSPEQALMNGKAWEDFCDVLKAAGAEILGRSVPASAIDRSEGYRYLTRLLGLGLDTLLEYADPAMPEFFRLQSAHRKYAGDNPDQLYDHAVINAEHRYRIRGTFAETVLIEVGVYAGSFTGENQKRRLVSYLDETMIHFGDDGRFEIVLSAEPHAGNWARLEPDAEFVLVRRYFKDPRNKQQQPMVIERVDGSPVPTPLVPAATARGLIGAAEFVQGNARIWKKWVERVRSRTLNTLAPMIDTGDLQTPGGVKYLDGYWQLRPEEALLIEFEPPNVPYWGFLIMNYWMESLDWRYRPVSINNYQVQLDSDGKARLVVAHRDPGHPNWLDTCGHNEGLMSMRCARLTGASPQVTARVVPIAKVAASQGGIAHS